LTFTFTYGGDRCRKEGADPGFFAAAAHPLAGGDCFVPRFPRRSIAREDEADMLHEGEVCCARPRVAGRRDEVDSVEIPVAKVIRVEVVCRVELPAILLPLE
jgi:hypothetical protein